MKNSKHKSKKMTMALLMVFGVGMILAIFGLAQAVNNIDEVAISKEPTAILASAGVTSGTDINLPVSYFDQKMDPCVNLYDMENNQALKTRQFEWTSCGYVMQQIEQGLVDFELSEQGLPKAAGGKLTPNKGLTTMARWFKGVDGKSKGYSDDITLSYQDNEGADFSFREQDFYPLDEVKFSAGDKVNSDGHNHLFTMNFAVPFTVTASGEENFAITADDDTFVFVGNKLAIDMGGVHDATTGQLQINEVGEVYAAIEGEDLAFSGITVNKGEGSIVRIFHADRDASSSEFALEFKNMNLNIVKTQLASGENGVQVAYDPSDPSYVAPLGESQVFQPDGTKGYIIMATIMGVVIVSCAMFTTIMAHALIKNR